MINIERQLHGYRQGHQLLAASVRLPKDDQASIDQLSDIAGPIRPRERFEPYLTVYPLPSGKSYVLAKTWQDLAVSRAGCVRTLSLILSAEDWATSESLSPFLDLLALDRLPEEVDATRIAVSPFSIETLPIVSSFQSTELLEALFLEDPLPIVVFDAPEADIVAIRLLTALWPTMRRRFAMSTFARSPRTVNGRSFDLVFAPKDARSKFSDWKGRRVDGRSIQTSRHRWSDSLISRVFEQPHPQLLSSQDANLISDKVDNASSLRIVLLWDELIEKLETTPAAVLGLLDIANSGMVRDSFALRALELPLSDAVKRAPVALAEADAWDFLGAMIRKMHGLSIPRGVSAMEDAVERLSAHAPEGAIALLSQPDMLGAINRLLPRMAEGIGGSFSVRVERALLTAEPEILGRLITGGRTLACRVAESELLVAYLSEVVHGLDPSIVDKMAADFLPYLVSDWQFPAAEPLIMRLDVAQLAEEVHHLGATNDFEAMRIAEFVIRRAREIGGNDRVRSALLDLPSSQRRNELVAMTLDASVDDAAWLMRDQRLTAAVSQHMLVELLRDADDRLLVEVIDEPEIGEQVYNILEGRAPDLVQRIVFAEGIGLGPFVRAVNNAFVSAGDEERMLIAKRALSRCLVSRFEGNELNFLTGMINVLGEHLDGAWAVRRGLSPNVSEPVASRNLVAFRRAAQPARLRVAWSVVEMAQVLRSRGTFDLNATAAEACADFFYDAEKATPPAALTAAGNLVPMLMEQINDPVSAIIAATFPLVYRELAKRDDVPDLLKFFFFVDWDRCKVARRELALAFTSSKWAPRDLALTACRCGDVDKIVYATAKTVGGGAYLTRVAADLSGLHADCRTKIERAISTNRSE